MTFRAIDDLAYEKLDDDYLVVVPGQSHVARLTDDAARAFELALSGTERVPGSLAKAMAGLVEIGIVQTDDWSRRRVIQLGGVATAAAVTLIALPSVAAAASSPPTTGSTTTSSTLPNPSPPDGLFIDNGPSSVSLWNGVLTTPITGLDNPRGLAYHSGDDVLYIVNRGNGTISSWDGGTLTNNVVTGLSNPEGLVVDPSSGDLFVAHGTVVSRWDGTTLTTPITGLNSPRGLAFHPLTGDLYIANVSSNAISRWDGSTLTNNVVTGLGGPEQITFQPGTANLYIANLNGDSVSRWDGSTLTTPITGIDQPLGVAFDPSGSDLYISKLGNGTISQWDGSTLTNNVVTGLSSPRFLTYI